MIAHAGNPPCCVIVLHFGQLTCAIRSLPFARPSSSKPTRRAGRLTADGCSRVRFDRRSLAGPAEVFLKCPRLAILRNREQSRARRDAAGVKCVGFRATSSGALWSCRIPDMAHGGIVARCTNVSSRAGLTAACSLCTGCLRKLSQRATRQRQTDEKSFRICATYYVDLEGSPTEDRPRAPHTVVSGGYLLRRRETRRLAFASKALINTTRLLQPRDECIHFPQHVGFIRLEHIVICMRHSHDACCRYATLECFCLRLPRLIHRLHLRVRHSVR